MKIAQVKPVTPVRIHLNTENKNRHQWARIVDARNGKVLHTGQTSYIKRVAKKRFNLELTF